MLHAAITSARAYANFAAPLAAASVPVVAPSFPHYGNTTLNVPSVANPCLEQLLGNAAVTVFGHSMGKLTALELALSSHRALRLLLYEPIVVACLNEEIAAHREALAWDQMPSPHCAPTPSIAMPSTGLRYSSTPGMRWSGVT